MNTSLPTTSLPQEFLSRLQQLFSAEQLRDVLAGMACSRPTAFRVNTLLAKDDETIPRTLINQGFQLTPLEWLDSAYVVPNAQRRALTESGPCQRGEIYIQNPSSMVPVFVLAPRQEERVLDLAAAPGSKTLQLAAMMQNKGWISAVEYVRGRFFRLRDNLKRHGAKNVHTYLKDGSYVWRSVAEQFDKVLLDAPCSSEGRFNLQQPETFKYWRRQKITEMARKQKRLLFSAIQCLKPGGTMVYSTCSLAPEENEAVIDAILNKFPKKLEIVPINIELPNTLAGKTGWKKKAYHSSLERARRLLPNEIMEGFFICKIIKHESTL